MSSLSFYNFSKTRTRTTKKGVIVEYYIVVLLRGGIQALVTVELNYDAWSNYCVIAYDYSPTVVKHSIARLYTSDAFVTS